MSPPHVTEVTEVNETIESFGVIGVKFNAGEVKAVGELGHN